jgi:hypothetical protein
VFAKSVMELMARTNCSHAFLAEPFTTQGVPTPWKMSSTSVGPGNEAAAGAAKAITKPAAANTGERIFIVNVIQSSSPSTQ